eukprot:scaffold484414_cov15-Prasinocladus_malaysianus.AAC.1
MKTAELACRRRGPSKKASHRRMAEQIILYLQQAMTPCRHIISFDCDDRRPHTKMNANFSADVHRRRAWLIARRAAAA